MLKKISSQRLQSLWSNKDSDQPKRLYGSRDLQLKKAIDLICMQADMAESAYLYTKSICKGIVFLYKSGYRPNEIIRHKIFFQKILCFGRNLSEFSSYESELFYLGIFIDLKINKKWKEITFFEFILKALKGISKGLVSFSSRIKEKIKNEFQLYNPIDYKYFFQIGFKNSA